MGPGVELDERVSGNASHTSHLRNLMNQVPFSEKRNWKGNSVDGRCGEGAGTNPQPDMLHLKCF